MSEAAFPRASQYSLPQTGMSLRDYFAAKAMQMVIRDWSAHEMISKISGSEVAIEAYRFADAMLMVRDMDGGDQ